MVEAESRSLGAVFVGDVPDEGAGSLIHNRGKPAIVNSSAFEVSANGFGQVFPHSRHDDGSSVRLVSKSLSQHGVNARTAEYLEG
jgi:hypothetical protein